VEQLNGLLHSSLKAKHETKGKQFFTKKYGNVTGNEMENIAELRGWLVPPAEVSHIQARSVPSSIQNETWLSAHRALKQEF